MHSAIHAARIGRVLATPTGATFDDDELVDAIDGVYRAAPVREVWIAANRAAFVAATGAAAAVEAVAALRVDRAPVAQIVAAEHVSWLAALAADRAAVDARAAARRLAAVIARAQHRAVTGT